MKNTTTVIFLCICMGVLQSCNNWGERKEFHGQDFLAQRTDRFQLIKIIEQQTNDCECLGADVYEIPIVNGNWYLFKNNHEILLPLNQNAVNILIDSLVSTNKAEKDTLFEKQLEKTRDPDGISARWGIYANRLEVLLFDKGMEIFPAHTKEGFSFVLRPKKKS